MTHILINSYELKQKNNSTYLEIDYFFKAAIGVHTLQINPEILYDWFEKIHPSDYYYCKVNHIDEETGDKQTIFDPELMWEYHIDENTIREFLIDYFKNIVI